MQNGLLRCLLYMALWGLLCFPLGRLFRRLNLRWDAVPFADFPWERSGRVYERLGIRAWKDTAPDVSKFCPAIVPPKAFATRPNSEKLRDMLAETCVAELTHALLMLTGLWLIPLWPGAGGIVTYILYAALGNAPFILIQRYNRPRFRRLLAAVEARERRRAHAGADTFEQ